MSYFTEVSDYQSYNGKKEDFHWNFNANSGGGQQFLGGKFFNEKGVLSSPTTLNGCIGIFNIMFKGEKNQDIFIPLDDQGQFNIKPRSKDSSSMKLEIGSGTTKMTNPNMLISSFFMLPPTCSVKKPTNLEISILTTSNYWLQSMWLKCNTTNISTKKVSLIPIDFIYCGGNEGNRFFKLDAQKRIADIISLSKNSDGFPNILTQNIKFFADIYLGNKPFNYDYCVEATRQIMILLADNYPDLYSGIEDPLPFLMKLKNNLQKNISILHNEPSQIIFYGAPGTGKSFKIKEYTQGDDTVIRTTFHPDSDYSTFVGCYKPTMEETNLLSLQKLQELYPEFKKTVANRPLQRFIMKHYSSFRKLTEKEAESVFDTIEAPATVTAEVPKVMAAIEELPKNSTITYSFVAQAFTKAYVQAWKKLDKPEPYLSKDLTFTIGTNVYTICDVDDVKITITKRTAKTEEGKDSPSENEPVAAQNENEDETITISKEEIREVFNSNNPNITDPIKEKIKERLKEDGFDDYDGAWGKLKEKVSVKSFFYKSQFLIIEEINRGNCAQIFGDLFQLLDRGDYRYSEYPIVADDDLRKELENEFTGLKLDTDVENFINSIFKKNYPDGITKRILKGELLVLPENLYIWATMNTSDQSLFPIDSAFKRRWEWKYIPIKNHEDKGYTIDIKGVKYDWWGFLARINQVIGETTSSEDKKLGYFFAKAKGKIIDAEQFVGKVLFYIWNDVFKNYGFDNQIFSKGDKKKFEFSDFFKNEGTANDDAVNMFLRKLEETIKIEGLPLEIKEESESIKTEE